jgi:hypothetical protein
MRDIRRDLEERAKLVENEATLVAVHCDQKIEEVTREHRACVAKLNAELAVLGVLNAELALLDVLTNSERQRTESDPQSTEPEPTANELVDVPVPREREFDQTTGPMLPKRKSGRTLSRPSM